MIDVLDNIALETILKKFDNNLQKLAWFPFKVICGTWVFLRITYLFLKIEIEIIKEVCKKCMFLVISLKLLRL